MLTVKSRIHMIVSFVSDDFASDQSVEAQIMQRKLLCEHLIGRSASSDAVGMAVSSCSELSEKTRREIWASEEKGVGIGWYQIDQNSSPLAQGIRGEFVHVIGFNFIPGEELKKCEVFVCPLSQFESEDTIPVKVVIGDLMGNQ